MIACIVQRVQWELGPVGSDVNMCIGKRVQGRQPDGDDSARVDYTSLDMMSPPFDLVSPPLELALSPL